MNRRIRRQRHRKRGSSETEHPASSDEHGFPEPDGYADESSEENTDEYLVETDDGTVDYEDEAEPERPWYGRPETSGPGRITVQFVGDDAEPEKEPELEAQSELEAEPEPAVEPGPAEAPEPAVDAEPPAEAESADADRPLTDGVPVVEPPHLPAEDPDNPEAFGRWLRSQRELRGIGLRAIADSSKISLGYLRGLESGRFDILPADVFTRGFLRQYARYVGLDPEEAINFYIAARDQVEEIDLDPRLVPSPPKEASGARWVVAALVLVALLLGVVWLLGRLSEERQAASDGAEAQRSAITVPEDAAPEDSTPEGTAAVSTAPDDAAAATDDVAAGDALPGDGATTAGSTEAATARQPSAASETAAVPASPLRVVLDFSDTCWVSAVIDGGETREKVHAQGESLTLDARSSIDLKVGNYRAVDVEVNGIPYDLRSRGRSNTVVRNVRIDLSALESGAASAPDSEAVPGAAG